MIWKFELEESYFKIYDENQNIAGYFDPEYGEIFPETMVSKIIEEMHKNHDKIPGGYLTLPLVKFELLDKEQFDMNYLENRIESVKTRLIKWKEFLSTIKSHYHKIHVSHTDSDMLSITILVNFRSPVSLEKKTLMSELESILNPLNEQGLL